MGAFQRAESDIVGKIALDDGQCLVTAGWRRRDGHHHAAGLVRVVRRMQHIAGLERLLAGYTEKVALDLEYLNTRSLWLDIKILFLTGLKVLRRDNVTH